MRVVIIGGGFAGIASAKKLYNQLAFEQDVEIILIDKNIHTTMLPSLPDVSGNRVNYKYLVEDIEKLIPRGVKFLNKVVQKVDFNNKIIKIEDKEIKYDYLIFSPGSKTNFFNHNEDFQKNYKLDCLKDALRIREDFYKIISKNSITNVVISGAGFTGMELACNLYNFAKTNNRKITVTLIERATRVLPMVSEKMSKYVTDKLTELKFEIITGDEVTSYEDEKVTLKSGTVIENAFFCWCSGVKISLAPIGNHKILADGRIIVDEYLRIPEHPEVFVAGDAAGVKLKDNYIRRAVNFAFMAGKTAGKNVALAINGGKLKPFKPVDLGWVIPLYISSIGVGLGVEMKGRIGIMLHYIMCGMKNYNGRNIRKYIKFGFTFVFTKVK